MSLREEVTKHGWYHTIDLPDGVTTDGWFDTRAAIDRMWFPSSLEGKRCLDVGTCDGFWAFSMEQRGAKEVVGIDVDDPHDRDWPAFVHSGDDEGRAKATFALAKSALGSNAERMPLNVYDLSPDSVGTFDFAFIGAILLHLRDPIKALNAVRTVTDELLIGDVVWLAGTRMFRKRPVALLQGINTSRWWTVNLAGLKRMCVSAGFEIIDSGGPFYVPFGDGHPGGSNRSRNPFSRVSSAAINRVGVPHGWVHARARKA